MDLHASLVAYPFSGLRDTKHRQRNNSSEKRAKLKILQKIKKL